MYWFFDKVIKHFDKFIDLTKRVDNFCSMDLVLSKKVDNFYWMDIVLSKKIDKLSIVLWAYTRPMEAETEVQNPPPPDF